MAFLRPPIRGFGSAVSFPSGVWAEPRQLEDFSVLYAYSAALLRVNSYRSPQSVSNRVAPTPVGARNYMNMPCLWVAR